MAEYSVHVLTHDSHGGWPWIHQAGSQRRPNCIDAGTRHAWASIAISLSSDGACKVNDDDLLLGVARQIVTGYGHRKVSAACGDDDGLTEGSRHRGIAALEKQRSHVGSVDNQDLGSRIPRLCVR